MESSQDYKNRMLATATLPQIAAWDANQFPDLGIPEALMVQLEAALPEWHNRAALVQSAVFRPHWRVEFRRRLWNLAWVRDAGHRWESQSLHVRLLFLRPGSE